MNISDIVQIQGSFKQKSQGKNVVKKNIGKEITDKIEFNVINELMGKFKYKKDKNGKSQTEKPPLTATQQTSPAYNLSLSKRPPPDWTSMPTKSEPAMSETEFEEAIRTLYLEHAERAMEIGNSGKSKSMINKQLYDLDKEFEVRGSKLETLFISVVSPDRKALYAKYDGENPFLYGSDGKMLMIAGPSFWACVPTEEEKARMSKYGQIRFEALNAYEAEHGQIPYTTISKSYMM